MGRGPNYTGRVLGPGGRYTVGDLLGEGGWGAVYSGVQTDLGRKVALKILHTDVALATEAVARFEREAKAAASFGHPNIAQVTDFQSNPGEPPFLVMEMLTGATLGQLLTRHVVLPSQRVASIMFQVLSALDVAHRAGIVHRDVKPDNVFLVSMPGIEDFVKLLDFGIAKLSAENLAQITDQGQLLGSPAFMSPEQVRSNNVDHRADLYSVGATMYYALAGRLPFDATSIPVLLTAIMEQKPKPLAEVAPSVDPRLAAIVERALHKDPNGRFASAADMRLALEPWVTSASHPGMGATLESAPTNGPRQPTRPIHVHDASNANTPGLITTGAPMVMSSSSSPMSPIPGNPYGAGGPPPSPYYGQGQITAQSPGNVITGPPNMQSSGAGAPAMAMQPYAAQPMMPPAYAQQKEKNPGAIIGILIGIVALLVLLGIGGAGAFYYIAKRDASATVVAQNGSSPTGTATATPTGAATGTGAATASGGAQRAPNGGPPNVHPGPSPSPTPTPNPGPQPNIVDAGGGGGGGRLATIDAGAPIGRKQQAGTNPQMSGGSFDKYTVEQGKAIMARAQPALAGCFVATEFDAPDHQFTCWSFVVDGSGNATSVKRSTEYDPLPKLDNCVIGAFRAQKWPPLAGGATPQICLAARTRDNP